MNKNISFNPEEYWEEEPFDVFVFDHEIKNREDIPFNVGDIVDVITSPIYSIHKIKTVCRYTIWSIYKLISDYYVISLMDIGGNYRYLSGSYRNGKDLYFRST